MDRNSIIGIVLIAAIFIVFGIVTQPSKEEQARIKHERDSVLAAQQKQKEQLRLQDTIQFADASKAADSVKKAGKVAQLGDFGKQVYGENEFYTIENDLLSLTVSRKGGRPYAVILKNYRTYDSLPLTLFDGDSTIFSLNFYKQKFLITTNDLFFEADSNYSGNIEVNDKPESLRLRLPAGENQYIEYTYTLSPGSYQVDLDVKFNGIEGVSGTGAMTNTIDLQWEILSPRQEKGWKNESNYTSVYYKTTDDVEFLKPAAKGPEEKYIQNKIQWVAFKDQFFSSVVIPKQAFEDAKMTSIPMTENGDYIKKFKTLAAIPYSAGSDTISLQFYFGPNKFKLLKKEYGNIKLEELVSVGRNIIKWINQGVIINLFHWLNKYISNFGIIILILTIIIKMALLPLTYKSYQSQAKMRVVKPMVDEATAKIPKDKPMERQQATMAIYKKVGVSPMGGCLPMILQMPILFAMFRFFPTSIELRQQSFLWATDLSTYDSIFEWTRQIPILSSIYGNHISLFTILMTVTTLISMKSTSGAQMGDSQMPGMKTMMYIMPVTFMFFLNNFSSALTYYYFLANVITLGQNYLFKLFVDEKEVLRKLEERKAKPRKKSKWQQRLEEMQKMQQQAAKKRK